MEITDKQVGNTLFNMPPLSDLNGKTPLEIEVYNSDGNHRIKCYVNGQHFFSTPLNARTAKRPNVKKDGKVLAKWRKSVEKALYKSISKQLSDSVYVIESIKVIGGA